MDGVQAARQARALALLTPIALLGGAYVSQYGFGLFPCEMCWWQRYAHFAALPLALLAFVLPQRRALTALAGVAIAVSAVIGAFHAGVEYGWWEGLTRCAINTGKGANPLDAIMNAPIIRCDVSPWDLFGISLAGWNFLFSGGAALLILVLLKRSGKAGS